MPKEVVAKIKLQVPGGQATPAPPVGPALGQHGLNIPEFIQRFNEAVNVARNIAGPEGTVVVTGSHHTVGDAMNQLGILPYGPEG